MTIPLPAALTSALGDELTELHGFRSSRTTSLSELGSEIVSAIDTATGNTAITLSAAAAGISPGHEFRLTGQSLAIPGATSGDAYRLATGDDKIVKTRTRVPQALAGFGATITQAGSVSTLTATRPLFTSDMVGRVVRVQRAAAANVGRFTISSVVSAYTITYTNAVGALETSTFDFEIEGVQPGDRLVISSASVDTIVSAVDDYSLYTVDPLPVFGPATYAVSTYQRKCPVYAVASTTSLTLGGIGLGSAVSSASWSAWSMSPTSIEVENAAEWPDTGTVFIGTTRYTYERRSSVTLYGLAHSDDRVGRTIPWGSMPGLASSVPPATEVVEFSQEYSALDRTRAEFLPDKAVFDALSTIGLRVGLRRPGLMSDTVFRAILQGIGYRKRSSIEALEIVLQAVFGEGNYTIFQPRTIDPSTDRIEMRGHKCTVYLAGSHDPEVSTGRGYLTERTLAQMSSSTQVTLPASTLVPYELKLAHDPIPGTVGPDPLEAPLRLIDFGSTIVTTDGITFTDTGNISTAVQPGDILEICSGQWAGRRATISSTSAPNSVDVGLLAGAAQFTWPRTLEAVATGIIGLIEPTRLRLPGGHNLTAGQTFQLDHGGGEYVPGEASSVANPLEIILAASGLPAAPKGTNVVTVLVDAPATVDEVQWRILRPLSNFRFYLPTDESYLEYPGDTGTTIWSYTGSTGDRSLSSGNYTQVEGGASANVFSHGLRLEPEGSITVDAVLSILPATLSSTASHGRQVGIRILDGVREVFVGAIQTSGTTFELGLVDASGGFLTSNQYAWDSAAGATRQIKIERTGNGSLGRAGKIRLWVNRSLVDEVDYTDLDTDGTPANLIWGCHTADTGSAQTIRMVELDWDARVPTDYASHRVGAAAGTVVATDSFADSGSGFVAGDVGRTISCQEFDGADLAANGSSYGDWEITAQTAGAVDVVGLTRRRARFRREGDVIELVEDELVWPLDRKHSLELLDGPYAGTYPIRALLRPRTEAAESLTQMDAINSASLFSVSPTLEVIDEIDTIVDNRQNLPFMERTRFVQLDISALSTPFDPAAAESRWRLVPNFAAASNIPFRIPGASTWSSPTFTLRDTAPFGANTVVEVKRSQVLSGQLLYLDQRNSSPATPSFAPLYLNDDFGLSLRRFIRRLATAGVVIDFDSLFLTTATGHGDVTKYRLREGDL